jgi:hypothetical protein
LTTPDAEITTITLATLRAMRAKLDEAVAIARAAEGCAVDGQPGAGFASDLVGLYNLMPFEPRVAAC